MRKCHETPHYFAVSDSKEIEFITCEEALSYVIAHADEGFDCVIESSWY